jgi:hypothetical protein
MGKPEGNNYLEDQGVDRRTILKYALKKKFGRMWSVEKTPLPIHNL